MFNVVKNALIEYAQNITEDSFELPLLTVRSGKETGNTKYLNVPTFTVFDWNNTDKVIDYLLYKNKIKTPKVYYARKLSVQSSSKMTQELKQFINYYHILGFVKHNHLLKVYYFEVEGEIIGAASFIKHKKGAELKRLVFKNDVSVVGGASKLISSFLKEYSLDIWTYSDRNISEGEVYEKLGFKKTKKEKPLTVYYNPEYNIKFGRNSLYLVGADRLLSKIPSYKPVGIGDGLPTNEEIVLSYGFLKYKDCGSYLWVKELKK